MAYTQNLAHSRLFGLVFSNVLAAFLGAFHEDLSNPMSH